jgi:hypothetical protein
VELYSFEINQIILLFIDEIEPLTIMGQSPYKNQISRINKKADFKNELKWINISSCLNEIIVHIVRWGICVT